MTAPVHFSGISIHQEEQPVSTKCKPVEVLLEHNYAAKDDLTFKQKYFQTLDRLETTSKELHNIKRREVRMKKTLEHYLQEAADLKLLSEDSSKALEQFKGRVPYPVCHLCLR